MANIREVVGRFAKEYGQRDWYARRDPVSELVFTILTQNTSDGNAFRAYEQLMRRFDTWEAIADGNPEEITDAIAIGGLSKVKGPRIKKVLEHIREAWGRIDLIRVGDMPLEDAKAWLAGLGGVGPKTAACVLLFSFGLPAMPVDTHVFRVAKRLGLIDERLSVEAAHEALETAVAADEVYALHVNLIEHGRRICQARRPRCEDCALADICPSSILEGAV